MWGRLMVLRIFGAAVPSYSGFRIFPFWLKHLSLKAKISSFSGTVKRVFRKRLRQSIDISEWSPPSD